MMFPEMQLAKKYCTGSGIEIGAAAHNPFGLSDCLNVAIKEDEEFYKKHQLDMCGSFAKIDVYARADRLPFGDKSFDYIITSHVVEHLQDLIGTFIEWNRVVKAGGIIFMIFPKRGALEGDKGRNFSTIYDFVNSHNNPPVIFDSTSHVWIFNLNNMKNLIMYCGTYYGLHWDVIAEEDTDTKAANGHTIVARVNE